MKSVGRKLIHMYFASFVGESNFFRTAHESRANHEHIRATYMPYIPVHTLYTATLPRSTSYYYYYEVNVVAFSFIVSYGVHCTALYY